MMVVVVVVVVVMVVVVSSEFIAKGNNEGNFVTCDQSV